MTPPPTVEILAIGNELLRGEILDTNTQWLCRLVTARGGRVGRVTLLADVEAEIAAAVRAAIERGVAVLFTSGGLGPTDDDLTLAAVARGAGVEVVGCIRQLWHQWHPERSTMKDHKNIQLEQKIL